MSIAQVGQWVLLVLGVATISVGLWRVLKFGEAGKMIPLFLFGVLFSGLATWQLAFVDPFTKIANAMMQHPSTETYGKALDAIAEGKVDSTQSNKALEDIVTNPVPGTDSLLAVAEQGATRPAIRAAILRARLRLKSEQIRAANVADSLYQKHDLDARAISALPTTTRILVGEHVALSPRAYSMVHADTLRNIARVTRVVPRSFTN